MSSTLVKNILGLSQKLQIKHMLTQKTWIMMKWHLMKLKNNKNLDD